MRLLCTWWRHDGRSLLSRPADSVGRSPRSVWIQSRTKCSYRVPFHSFFRFPLCCLLLLLIFLYFAFALYHLSFFASSFLSFFLCLPHLSYSVRYPFFNLFSFSTSSLFSLSLSRVCFPSLSALILGQFATYLLSAHHPCGALHAFTETSLGYVFEGYAVL